MKKFKVKVDGKVFEVEVEAINDSDENIDNLATNQIKKDDINDDDDNKEVLDNKKISSDKANTEGEDIVAPLPGVISVKVKKGKNVSKGDIILILEAMKMENEITAPIDGTLQELYVSTGDTVETGELLARII